MGHLWHAACFSEVRALAFDSCRAPGRLSTLLLPSQGVPRASADLARLSRPPSRSLRQPEAPPRAPLPLSDLSAHLLPAELCRFVLPQAARADAPGRRRSGRRLGPPADRPPAGVRPIDRD